MKKECYLTPENFGQKIKNWQQDLVDYQPHPKKTAALTINTAALLVLDMQEYFLSPDSHAFIPQATHLLSTLEELQRFFQYHQRPVIQTQHRDSMDSPMARWWQHTLTPSHPNFKITPQLHLPRSIQIQKHHYSAFHHTSLTALLKTCQVKQVVIAGVMTHLCCETTARGAFMEGFDVIFLIDGTATYNEDLHRGSLRALAHGFATLQTCQHLRHTP